MALRDHGSDRPRDLVLGLLALKNDLVDRAPLFAALRDRERPLVESLLSDGSLTSTRRDLLEALTSDHLERHGSDSTATLEALVRDPTNRELLSRLCDTESTLSIVGTDDSTDDGIAGFPARTSSLRDGASSGVGSKTSDGSRFRVLRPHARGGLGEVFVAVDAELNRDVALKQIQEHFADDPASRARFVLEAKITGGLEHPGVVPVYGLGAYPDGRPYYAMRFIRGASLQDAIAGYHADPSLRSDPGGRALALSKLLRRFLDVCNAIEYAHSRGVLHRDLKPANVMVGGHGETLVVDWGLAKAIGASRADGELEAPLHPGAAGGSVATSPGSAMGTPAYMSPEQARGDLEALGPQSDVYSLGATLYCLLTGTAPFPPGDVLSVLKAVEAGDFPPPRRVDRTIAPALEAVCLKAMALAPEDRYQSPRALADDLERWMADEPVSAYPEPLPARARRWGRRHRTAVSTAAGAILVALVGLCTVIVVQEQARREIERSLGRESLARQVSQSVNEFLQKDLLGQADIANQAEGVERNRDVTVRELLDRAARRIEARFQGQASTEAAIRSTVGQAYRALGEYAAALKHLERSLELRTRELGAEHRDALESAYNLAILYDDLGRGADSERLHKQVLEARSRTLGDRHPDSLMSMNGLGLLYCELSRYEEAEALLRQALEIRRATLAADDADIFGNVANLAYLYWSRKDYAAAEPLYKQAWEGWRARLGEDHPETLKVMDGLAGCYMMQGRREEAFPLFERELALSRSGLGPDHIDTLSTMHNLGVLLRDSGRYDEAEPLLRDAAEGAVKRLGLDHPKTPTFVNNFADLHAKRGTPQLAEPLLRDLASALRGRAEADPNGFCTQLWYLYNNLKMQGKFAEAERVSRESLDVTARHRPDSWLVPYVRSLVGDMLLKQKRYAEAEPMLIEGYRGMKSRESQAPERIRPIIVDAVRQLVELYEAWDRPAQAAEWRARLTPGAAEGAKP